MESFEVEVGGQIYEVEADTPQQAATYARLLAARKQGVAQAEAGAVQRSEPSASMGPSDPGFYGDPNDVRNIIEAGKHRGTAEAAGPTAAILGTAPLVAGAISAPGATAASLGTGYVGSELGERGGRFLEEFGAPAGTSKALKFIGGLAGGVYGGVKSQQILNLLKSGKIRPGGMLGNVIDRLAGTEAAGAATAARQTPEALAAAEARAAQKAEAEILKIRAQADKAIAAKEDIAARAAQREERHRLQAEILRRRAAGELPPARQPRTAAPKPTSTVPPQRTSVAEDILPDEYVSAVVEPLPETVVLPKGQRAMATNLGGTAKPGPAPTPPEKVEEALRATVEANATKQGERPFAGSMSKEFVRRPAEQLTEAQIQELARSMPKGQGPGTIEWALGRRPRGAGDIPQITELERTARELASGPDTPKTLATKLLDWANKAKRPAGPLRGRETGNLEPTLERKKLKLELARLLQDPQWRNAVGSDEVINTGIDLEEKLLGKLVSGAVKTARAKAGFTGSWADLK